MEGRQKFGQDPFLTDVEELKIVDWIKKLAKCGVPAHKSDVQSSVQKMLQADPTRKNPFKDDRPGDCWFRAFLKRHSSISIRKPERVSKARAAITETEIRKWFNLLRENLREINALDILEDPDRIFNSDETAIRLCPASGKVLGEKAWKNIYEIAPGPEKVHLPF